MSISTHRSQRVRAPLAGPRDVARPRAGLGLFVLPRALCALFLALLALAFLGWRTPLCGAESFGRDDFKGAGLCQFALHEYKLSTNSEAALNKAITEALRKHEEVFGFKAPEDFRVRVRIFGRFPDFAQFTLTNRYAQQIIKNGQGITNLGGYYSHRLRYVVTWPQRHASDLANTLLHEASHAIMDSSFRRMPIWLAEGSATFFAYPRHMQDNRDIGTLNYRWGKLVLLQRSSQLPAVRNLFNMTPDEWNRMDPAYSYSTAWSLFQLMMSTPARKEDLRKYLRELQHRQHRETAPADIYESLNPGGIPPLEKDWHDWIIKGGRRVLGPKMEELLQQVR